MNRLKNILFYVLIFIVFLSCKDTVEYKKFFIFNFYGTELKEKPSFNSKTLQNLKLGDSIYVIEKTSINTKKKLFENELYLKGEWSKVKHENKTGFIFNGDYSKLKIKTKKNKSNYILLNYGEPKSKSKTTKDFIFYDKPYKQYILKENYEFFTEVTKTNNFDVGESYEIISYKLSLNEMINFIYMLLKVSNDSENGKTIGYGHPNFQEYSNNTYLFDGPGFLEDIKIKQHKNHVSLSYHMGS